MLFLQVEGFTRLYGNEVELTPRGDSLAAAKPWYQLLVGGYGQAFAEMGGALASGSQAVPRDYGQVGVGSCGISNYDAIPLTKRLLGRLHTPPAKIVDLGCGNALYLSELSRLLPGLRAVGVEPSEDGYEKAEALIRSANLADRIDLICCSAQEFVERNIHPDADVILLGFVLHEILGHDGEDGLESFLKRLASRYGGRHIVVIEVDDQIEDPIVMQHPLARAYYNPYYLLHHFTGQRLEKRKFWDDLFARLSFKLVAEDTTDPEIDSTGLEFGLLLELP
jgi:2-ketoarginine methyltransferase